MRIASAAAAPITPRTMPKTISVCWWPALQHRIDRKGCCDRAEAVASGNDPGGQAAPIREPADHQPDDPDINDASADAAKQAIRQIEADQAGGAGRQHPASA
jgi:hypothetical protein